MSMKDDQRTVRSLHHEIEPYGQASLLLVESLIHGLCENATLTSRAALDIADRAVAVQRDVAETSLEASPAAWQAHKLLESIAASLAVDASDTDD